MKDIVVIQRLRERGSDFNNLDAVLPYEAVEHKPRYLDKAPNRLSLLRADEGSPVYSTYTNYLATYEKVKQQYPLEFGTFDLRGIRRRCDIELFWTAQAILLEGITAIPDKLQACASLFKLVLTTPSEDYLSKGMVLERLEKYFPENFFARQLLKGIYRTAYECSDLTCEWLEEIEFDHTFTNGKRKGIEFLNGMTDSSFSLQDFIKTNAVAAKADQDFMNLIGKGFLTNKTKPAMIAMIYYFRDTVGIMDYGYIISV